MNITTPQKNLEDMQQLHETAPVDNVKIQAAFEKARRAMDELGRLIAVQPRAPRSPKTNTKRAVIIALLKEHGPLDAYQLVEKMKEKGILSGRNPVNNVRSFAYRCPELQIIEGKFHLRPETKPTTV